MTNTLYSFLRAIRVLRGHFFFEFAQFYEFQGFSANENKFSGHLSPKLREWFASNPIHWES
jgi:hypothetical protein